MRRLLASFATFAIALSLTAPGAAQQQPIKLVFATYVPRTITLAKSADWFMDEVTKRSGGRLVFERYYAQSLMPVTDLVPALSRGAIDFSLASPGYSPKDSPYSLVVMPYTTDKVDAIAYALNELYEKNAEYRHEFESKGIVMLWHTPNVENTLWTMKKVTSRADLKGLRLRAMGQVSVAYEALGATPVTLSPIDAVEAFKRGAIDGITTWPIDAGIAQGVDRIAKYVSDSGKMGIYGGLLMAANKRKLDSLPPDLRAIVMQVVGEATKKYVEMTDADVQAAAVALAKNTDITLVELPAEEAKAWQAVTQPRMRDVWLDQTPDKRKATEMLTQFQGLVKKYEASSTYLPGIERVKKIKAAAK